MDGGERSKSITKRLGFKRMGCCGAKLVLGSTRGDHEEEETPSNSQIGLPHGHSPAASGMILAAALAIESENEETIPSPVSVTAGPPLKMPLMKFLEETEDWDEETKYEEEGGCDSLCCVCMGREKGAAFIPCGHTFCSVCSRELWRNKRACPLCNRYIIDILDIY
ncbi:death-associated inhibitor of apoptosis 1-like isoform X2 [Olea europaea subsp. europaea]|uniref:Death-associated inhibitor of apoptosis 1-like isoform X2 n=1 Tax=Olea europaea subsp. europaea TaxID=158383 RepID=A0A8S0S532_OLEEU|nr:death-associated inhibitor of apoptosis 1-like isoform X2 [Olea europaea subsp. europaea]